VTQNHVLCLVDTSSLYNTVNHMFKNKLLDYAKLFELLTKKLDGSHCIAYVVNYSDSSKYFSKYLTKCGYEVFDCEEPDIQIGYVYQAAISWLDEDPKNKILLISDDLVFVALRELYNDNSNRVVICSIKNGNGNTFTIPKECFKDAVPRREANRQTSLQNYS
jgi:hypothetical protein